MRVMLVGSGELSRELVLAFQRLGATVIAVDRYADEVEAEVRDFDADRSAFVAELHARDGSPGPGA